MKDRSFLYELRAYLIYGKVGERSFLYELRAYLTYVKVGEIEDIWLFQCKIDFYFTEWTATCENTTFGVQWNKNWSYTEKVKFSVSFIL